MEVGYEDLTGTGYDPFSGDMVGAWSCVLNLSPNTYYGSFATPGFATITSPTYITQITLPSLPCSTAIAGVIAAAGNIAREIVTDSATFGSAVLKIGASTVSATVFASSFLAAGAEVTFASASAFVLACLAFFTVGEWIALCAVVGGLAATIYAIYTCSKH